jgi:hypothetical protein
MSETGAWRALATTFYTLKTWMRRTIWGDRVCPVLVPVYNHLLTTLQLFLCFEGPTTMLLQSRASRVRDVLTLRDVNEIAESPPGAVQDAVTRKIREEIKEIGAGTKAPTASVDASGTVRYATIRNGKAEFEKSPM